MHSCVKCAFPFRCSLFVTASKRKRPKLLFIMLQRSILPFPLFVAVVALVDADLKVHHDLDQRSS
jgi:hypothetical protein